MNQTHRELSTKFRIVVFNSSSETVPAYGVMQVVGATSVADNESYTITKPIGAPASTYLVNGPSPIPSNQYGVASSFAPVTVAYNAFEGAPLFGQEWGPPPPPFPSSWLLSPFGTGFQILGGIDVTGDPPTARAIPSGGTGGGSNQNGDVPIIFIRNVSGLPLNNRNIVGIGPPIVFPTQVFPLPAELPTQPSFDSTEPARNKTFAIIFGDVAAGGMIDAITVGEVAVKVNITSAQHTHAEPINGDYVKLRSCTHGPARILYRERGHVSGEGSLGVQWAMVELGIERYRLIRGEVYTSVQSTDQRFEIKNIKPLASGLDPRTDTSSTTERIWVANVHGDEYAADDKIVAAYHENVISGSNKTDWEALKKAGGGGVGRWGRISKAAPAATVAGEATTDGRIIFFGDSSETQIGNFFPDIAPVGAIAYVEGANLVSWSCGTLPAPPTTP